MRSRIRSTSAPPRIRADGPVLVLQDQVRLVAGEVAVADQVEDVASVAEFVEQALLGDLTVVGEHPARQRRQPVLCALDLFLDGHRGEVARLESVEVRRAGHDDQGAQRALGPQPDRAPVVAGQVAREHDVLVGQQRGAVAGVEHRLPAQAVQRGGARTDEQPDPQGDALALRRRDRLPVGVADRRHRAGPGPARGHRPRRPSSSSSSSLGSMSTVRAPSTLMSASDSCWL